MVDSRPNVWQMQSQQDIQGLIQALQYPDPEVRGRAAVALRTLDAVAAVPALKAVLQDEIDAQTRKYLKEALHVLDQRTDVGLMAQKADFGGLVGALKSTRSETVIAAARALGTLGNRLAVEPLVMVFHSPTSPPAVRLAAAEALLELKSAPAVVTLLGALRRDSWQVRRNAAAVLGQIQAIWAVEPLAQALHDSHPVVRRTAAAALKRIGTADAIMAMRKALQGEHSTPDDEAKRSPDPVKERPEEREAPREVQRHDAGPVEEVRSQAVESLVQETKFHFDSKPAGLKLDGDKQPEDVPQPDRNDLSETETGEVSEAHDTHPSESTRPVMRAVATSRETVEIVGQTDRSPDAVEPESEQTKQAQRPVSRLIAFFRRWGDKH